MKIVLATHNKHKVEEIRSILSGLPFELLSLDNFPEIGEIIEDGDTIEANARKKARVVYGSTGLLSLADDSGLEVESLNGRPGVHSARYSGDTATDEENNLKLLGEMRWIPADKRKAKFRCAISIIGAGIDELAIGEVPGTISEVPRGSNGFGYDPFFVPEGYTMTYSEMDSRLKNSLSHRAMALNKAKDILTNLTSNK